MEAYLLSRLLNRFKAAQRRRTMAKIFTNYPEDSKRMFKKGKRKRSKKFCKEIKEIRKEMKRRRKLEEERHQNEVQRELLSHEDSNNKCTEENKVVEKKGKSFLNKVSDAFFKVLPGIISTAASMAITSVFGCILKKSRKLRVV